MTNLPDPQTREVPAFNREKVVEELAATYKLAQSHKETLYQAWDVYLEALLAHPYTGENYSKVTDQIRQALGLMLAYIYQRDEEPELQDLLDPELVRRTTNTITRLSAMYSAGLIRVLNYGISKPEMPEVEATQPPGMSPDYIMGPAFFGVYNFAPDPSLGKQGLLDGLTDELASIDAYKKSLEFALEQAQQMEVDIVAETLEAGDISWYALAKHLDGNYNTIKRRYDPETRQKARESTDRSTENWKIRHYGKIAMEQGLLPDPDPTEPQEPDSSSA